MKSEWSHFFQSALQRADELNRKRARRVFDQGLSVDFGSNDYLGLRSHPKVLAALQNRPPKTAWGAGASPVLSGYSQQHQVLERALAKFSGAASALCFTSGFACNAGTISCLASSEDLILSDQLNHASLIDGCRLSRAQTVVFPHADAGFVRDFLQRERSRFAKVLLLTESIFSMDGDAAPLAELADLAHEFDGGVIVDEAHAVGIYGQLGGGLIEELGLQKQVLAKLGTLSKAIGGVGGYVAGDHDLIEYLVNYCRSYLFSTAAPATALSAATIALNLLQDMNDIRQRLRSTARELRCRIKKLGFEVKEGDSPIIPILVGTEANALALSKKLWDAGIYVPAIRPPTVPEGSCRLRISLSANHTAAQLEQLLAAIA